jgi:hypothetical protein
MKKDIEFPQVEGVQLAITRERNMLNEFEWEVYLLNHNDFPLNNILITSKGYGVSPEKGEHQKTSILRHMIPFLDAKEFAKIEPIHPSVFHLCNEYWVSYYIGNKIYDKKFIFMPDSIIEPNLSRIQMLQKDGVLHS